MVVREPTKRKTHEGTRNILAYFLSSKLWKTYCYNVTDNVTYWESFDPFRADAMTVALAHPTCKGYTVSDYFYDMWDCIFSSELKARTKDRLMVELDELEVILKDKDLMKETMHES